jgi:hypothetical protein
MNYVAYGAGKADRHSALGNFCEAKTRTGLICQTKPTKAFIAIA